MAADPSTTDGARFDTSAGNGRVPHDTPADALKDLMRQVAELRSHIGYFLSAKRDGIIVSLRNAGVYAALGLVGLIVVAGMLVTAVVLLLAGLAGAISAMFDAPAWVGQLIIGALVLAGMGGGVWFGLSWMTGKWRKRTVNKYERKRSDQRAEFGHDVHDRAVKGG